VGLGILFVPESIGEPGRFMALNLEKTPRKFDMGALKGTPSQAK